MAGGVPPCGEIISPMVEPVSYPPLGHRRRNNFDVYRLGPGDIALESAVSRSRLIFDLRYSEKIGAPDRVGRNR